jgi:hypothetical protein
MFTVEPPDIVFAREKVTVGLELESEVYWVEFRRYMDRVSFQVRPKAFSNSRQALLGSHMLGSVDSTNA